MTQFSCNSVVNALRGKSVVDLFLTGIEFGGWKHFVKRIILGDEKLEKPVEAINMISWNKLSVPFLNFIAGLQRVHGTTLHGEIIDSNIRGMSVITYGDNHVVEFRIVTKFAMWDSRSDELLDKMINDPMIFASAKAIAGIALDESHFCKRVSWKSTSPIKLEKYQYGRWSKFRKSSGKDESDTWILLRDMWVISFSIGYSIEDLANLMKEEMYTAAAQVLNIKREEVLDNYVKFTGREIDNRSDVAIDNEL